MNELFPFVAQTSFQASLLALAVLAVQMLGRRWISARLRHALWLIVIARLVVPVSWSMPGGLPVVNLLGERPDTVEPFLPPSRESDAQPLGSTSASVDVGEVVRLRSVTLKPDDIGDVPDLAAVPVTPERRYLGEIWAAGAIIAAVWLDWRFVQLQRAVRQWPLISEGPQRDMLTDCATELGVRRRVALRRAEVGSPAVIGVWRPCVLLPEFVKQLSEAELRLVFLHELQHVRRFDVALNWGLSILSAIHWFNPILRGAFRLMDRVRELACDEGVIARLPEDDRRLYARTLVKVLELSQPLSRPALSVGAVSLFRSRNSVALLEERIRTMSTLRKPRHVTQALLATALFLGLGWLGFTRAEDPPAGNVAADAVLPTPDASPGANQVQVKVGTELAEVVAGTRDEPATTVVTYPIDDALKVFESALQCDTQTAEKHVCGWAEAVTIRGRAKLLRLEPQAGLEVFGTARLVVRADDDAQKAFKSALTRLVAHGLHEFVIETSFARTTLGELEALGLTRDAHGMERWKDLFARLARKKQIQQSLNMPMSLHFRNAPVGDVLKQIQTLAKVNVHLDEQGLQEAGVTTAVPVAVSIDKIPMKRVLSLLLEPLNLGYVVQNDVIKITSKRRCSKDSENETPDDEFIGVSQILDDSAKARVEISLESRLSAPKVRLYDGYTAQISHVVKRPFVVGFDKGEFQVKTIDEGTRLHLRPVVNEKGIFFHAHCARTELTKVGTKPVELDDGRRVDVQVPEVSTRFLDVDQQIQSGQTLVVACPEADFVTSEERPMQIYLYRVVARKLPVVSKDELVTLNYAVADLVLPIPTHRKAAPDTTLHSQPLVDLVRTVEPESWGNGGGSVQFYEKTLSLIVRQRPEVQQKIADLLSRIRKTQDESIQATLVLFTVTEEQARAAGLEVEDEPQVDGSEKLVSAVEDALRQGGTRLSAPKVMLLNGTTAEIQVDDTFQSLVSAQIGKKNAVRLRVAMNATEAADALASSWSATVPEGSAMLIDATHRLRSAKTASQPLVFAAGRDPELRSKLTPGDGKRTFLLVVPKVVVSREEAPAK